MLYQYDLGKEAPDTIVNLFWDMNEQAPKVREFADILFRGTITKLKEIDRLIQSHTRNWRLSRMAAVDRNVLRLAVFELLADAGTPDTVVINEALEIAKKFSTDESAQFVNGVLDSIKNDLLQERLKK